MTLKPLPKETLIARHIYRLHSRNLDFGAFDGERGFIGIREKFGDRFLFKEYLADGGAFGTVHPLEDVGVLPEQIELREDLGSKDSRTERWVKFDKPVSDGGRGWYYQDTDEADQDIRPYGVSNDLLFKYLEVIEKERANPNE